MYSKILFPDLLCILSVCPTGEDEANKIYQEHAAYRYQDDEVLPEISELTKDLVKLNSIWFHEERSAKRR